MAAGGNTKKAKTMKNEDLKQIVEINFSATRALLQAQSDMSAIQFGEVQKELKAVRDHQVWQNGKLEKHEEQYKVIQWLAKHKGLTAIAIILFVFGSMWLYDNLCIWDIIEWLKLIL